MKKNEKHFLHVNQKGNRAKKAGITDTKNEFLKRDWHVYIALEERQWECAAISFAMYMTWTQN